MVGPGRMRSDAGDICDVEVAAPRCLDIIRNSRARVYPAHTHPTSPLLHGDASSSSTPPLLGFSDCCSAYTPPLDQWPRETLSRTILVTPRVGPCRILIQRHTPHPRTHYVQKLQVVPLILPGSRQDCRAARKAQTLSGAICSQGQAAQCVLTVVFGIEWVPCYGQYHVTDVCK